MEEDEFIQKLKERYENGEISRETYEDILSRYEKDICNDEKGTDNEEENKVGCEEPGDYKCAGSCTMGAGTYRKVSIAGSVEITGDIKAEKISAAGAVHASGNIYAEQFKSAGSTRIDGILKAEEISVAGMLFCRELIGERITIGGTLTAELITGEHTTIEGNAKVQKIKTEKLQMKLDGKSKVEEIECEEVEIRTKRSWWKKCRGWLYVGKIIGERIELDCVRADEVEGNDVKIGEHCEIGTVIGENVKVDRNAKVGRVVRK
ncbi:MAG: hypothetical protein GXO25_02755 [Euryarchaeota archaeon]|nr:hypothetical protein [Euryarchaeota archaeon]